MPHQQQQRFFELLEDHCSPQGTYDEGCIDSTSNHGSSNRKATVYGRDDEFELMREAFDRVSKDDRPSSEFLQAHGPAGYAKSPVVKTPQQVNKGRG